MATEQVLWEVLLLFLPTLRQASWVEAEEAVMEAEEEVGPENVVGAGEHGH